MNTKELVLVFIFIIIFLCTLPTNYFIHGQAPVNDIKITSPNTGQVVPVGNLTIQGTSSDNANSDCQVYVDWNNQKPFQNASPTGAAGANDYSNWTFTYTNDYHLITKGSNELTANLFCLDNPSPAAYSSINIIGQSPTRLDTGTKSDTGTRQYSGGDSGRDSREEPFQFVRFCVIVEDYSDGDNKDNNKNNNQDNNKNNNQDNNKNNNQDNNKNDNQNGCGGSGDNNDNGNDDGNGGDGGCKKIIDKNGNGFKDEIKAKEKSLGLKNHENC